MLPTFILAGAGRSGTTTTWNYLQAHPDICMASIKEPMFFTQNKPSQDRYGPKTPLHYGRYDRGLDWYQSLFEKCKGVKAIGEASTIYMLTDDSPGLIKQHIPDVQVIFILRDPVERLYSSFLQEQKLGLCLENFSEMVAENHPRIQHYAYASAYHLHLARYLKTFSRQQISVFLFDDLQFDQREFMQTFYRSLDVDPDFYPENLEKRYNQARTPKVIRIQRLLSFLTRVGMRAHLSPWLYIHLAKIRRNLVNANSAPLTTSPIPLEVRSQLIIQFSHTIKYIEIYLQRKLPAWWAVNR